MKRTITIAAVAAFALALLCGCEDGGSIDANPDIVAEGASISRTQLVEAVWGTSEEPLPDAECLASSSFKIKAEAKFDIMKNPKKSAEHKSEALVVSPITIVFDDEGNDGRGANCSSGSFSYTVLASPEEPIDILSSLELKPRHSVERLAATGTTEYPSCRITGYFEPAGVEICSTETDEDQDPQVQEPEDQGDIQEQEDDQADDVADDEDDDDAEDDDSDGPVIVVPGWVGLGAIEAYEFKAVYVDKPVICGDEEVHSVRMVVNDYDCRMEEIPSRFRHEALNSAEQK